MRGSTKKRKLSKEKRNARAEEYNDWKKIQ